MPSVLCLASGLTHDQESLIAAAALVALSAHAGYALKLGRPCGLRCNFAGHTYAASAANDKVFGNVIHQPNGLRTTVAGQAVKMPASYRLAANAPRIAAQVLFLHPGIRTVVGIAAGMQGENDCVARFYSQQGFVHGRGNRACDRAKVPQ